MDIERIVSNAFPQFQRIANRNQLVKWEEESQFALQAVLKSAKLQECAPHTVQDAIINVAAVGLTLNPAHGYAYLVPEYNRSTGNQECQLRISFKGLIKIATDSGVVDWVAADIVKKGDSFKFNGKWELPTHEMDPFAEDRGASVGVYCVVKMHDGQVLCEVAPWSEVLKAKTAAKIQNVWNEWEDEMAKKFIIKRASKQWPKTDHTERLNTAVHIMNENEGSEKVLERMDTVAAYLIKHLAEDDAESVIEAWEELTDEEKAIIWTAKTKGGWLTIDEKKKIQQMRHNRWEERVAAGEIEDKSKSIATGS